MKKISILKDAAGSWRFLFLLVVVTFGMPVAKANEFRVKKSDAGTIEAADRRERPQSSSRLSSSIDCSTPTVDASAGMRTLNPLETRQTAVRLLTKHCRA
jgi:hypothetical protein